MLNIKWNHTYDAWADDPWSLSETASEIINSLHFADDTAIIAESLE